MATHQQQTAQESSGLALRLPGIYTSENVEKKRNILLSSTLIGISFTLWCFGTYNFTQGNYTEGIVSLLTSLGFFITIFNVIPVSWRRLIARICISLLTCMLFYMISSGIHDGFVILWLYAFPLALFFFLGNLEGWIWVLAVLGGVGIIFFNNGLSEAVQYENTFKIRFIISFLMVSIFSYFIESFRQRAHERLLVEQQKLAKEKKNLQMAMEEISILRGIIPICTHCKEIKDCEGSWTQLEEYISQHSDAKFTHRICPSCEKKHNPKSYTN